MGKLDTIIILTVVIVLLFHFGGLITGTPTGFVLKTLGLTNLDKFENTDFYSKILFLTTGIVAGGIFIGTLISPRVADAILGRVKIPVAGVLLTMVGDLLQIFDILKGVNEFFAILLIAPWMVILVIAVLDWVVGGG